MAPKAATATKPDQPPRRSLVTGGAGFIGSHLARLLLSRGDLVTVIDNLSTGRRINLPQRHARLRFIESGLSDALETTVRGETFDEVYHLAAAVGVKLIMADPIASIETNVSQAAALLRFAAACGPARSGGCAPAKTLIASSSEVYGKSPRVPCSEDDDVTYGATPVSRWSYAATKAVDEYLALAYHAKHRLPVVVTRFFNTIGPGQVGDYGMVVPRFVERALAGADIEIYGDGSQSRCFCDVRDVVRALPALLDSPPAAGRVFNIGSDDSLTINQLAQAVIRETRSNSAVRFVRYSDAYEPGFEDLILRKPALARVRSAINFSPAYTLERTIRDVAAWISGGKGPGADWSDWSDFVETPA